MDRAPEAAPFSVGTIVEQVATHRSWFVARDGTHVPLEQPGQRVAIAEVKPGRRGTLRQIGEDDVTGDPILDTTRDAYSVWYVEYEGERKGRIQASRGREALRDELIAERMRVDTGNLDTCRCGHLRTKHWRSEVVFDGNEARDAGPGCTACGCVLFRGPGERP